MKCYFFGLKCESLYLKQMVLNCNSKKYFNLTVKPFEKSLLKNIILRYVFLIKSFNRQYITLS